jgi:hypothetical protein
MTSNTSLFTPTRIPPAVPLAGRKFQIKFLFPKTFFKKELVNFYFLVSWKPM